MTSKNQIRLVLGLVTTISFGVSLLSLFYLSRMVHRLGAIATVDSRITEISESISYHLLQARQAEKNYIIFFDSTYLAENEHYLHAMEEDIAKAKRISTDFQAQFDSIQTEVNRYRSLIHRLSALLHEEPQMLTRIQQSLLRSPRGMSQKTAGDAWRDDLSLIFVALSNRYSSDKLRIFDELKVVGERILLLSQKMTQKARVSLIQNTEEAILYGERARRNILTLLFLTLILVGWFVYYLPHRIFRPFMAILRALQAITRGDMEFNLPNLVSRDEIGEISRAFVEATRKIRYFNELITEKIVEIKRNYQRILEEVSEGVILAGTDFKITYMNQKAREFFDLKREAATLKDIPPLWASLQGSLDRIEETGRFDFALPLEAFPDRSVRVSVIPRSGKSGRRENLLIILR